MFTTIRNHFVKSAPSTDLVVHTIATANAVRYAATTRFPEMNFIVTAKVSKLTGEALITLTSDRAVWNRNARTTPANLIDNTIKQFKGNQEDMACRFVIIPARNYDDANLVTTSYEDGTSEFTATWEVLELGSLITTKVE